VDELATRRLLAERDEHIEVLNRLIENMETQHVTWSGPDGRIHHPDWCRECRVSVLLALLWAVMTNQSGALSRRTDDQP
jgi:hypothetical protein